MWRAGIVASALGLVSGLAGVWLGMNVLGHHDATSTSLHAVIHDELSLTAAQEAQIDALEAQFAVEKADYDRRLREARRAIGTSIMADRAMSEDVEATAATLHAIMGELQLATLNHILAMREVMNEEQRAEFDRRLAGAFDVGS